MQFAIEKKHLVTVLLLTALTVYLTIYPISFVKSLSDLPWLAMCSTVLSMVLGYHYRQGKVLFTSVILLTYQALPLGDPQLITTSFYTSIVPQLILVFMVYLTITEERGVSWSVINESVLTVITMLIGLTVVNMLLNKYAGITDIPIGIYLTMLGCIPFLIYFLWINGSASNVVFCYIGIGMSVMGCLGVPANNLMLFFYSAALLFVVLNESHKMAYRDELTGINSRRAMEVAANGLGKRYVVVMADVDHFKKFNDSYGHDTGDDVLRLVAKKLGQVSGGGTAFRYGGEEFCLIFKNKSAVDIFQFVEASRQDIENYRLNLRGKNRETNTTEMRGQGSSSSQQTVNVTMSFGIAETTTGEPFEVLLKRSDKLLYAAKAAGRNRVMLPSAIN